MEKDKKAKNRNRKIKSLKIVLFILLLMILFAGVMYGTVKVLEIINKDETASGCTYVAKEEDGSYYIAKAPKKIKFRVKTENVKDYIIKDSSDNEVQTQIINDNNELYLTAINEYQEGATYYLTVNSEEAALMDENLLEARNVTFKIDKKEVVKYEFKDNVKVTKTPQNISKDGNVKTLELAGQDYKVNDIIILEENKNATDAYKISKIENNKATLTTPELPDIYNDLEIYKEIQVDFNQLEINDEFKDEILMAYERTEWYQYLENVCYAEIVPSIKIIPSGVSLKIEADFRIKKNDSNPAVGLKALKNHELNIKFTTTLSCQILPDIDLYDHMDFTATLNQEFDCKIELKQGGKILEGIDKIKDEDYDKSLERLWDFLEGKESDSASSKTGLCAVELPTGLYGLNVYADIYLQTKLDVNVNATLEENVRMTETVGMRANSSGITPYANVDCAFTNTNISIEGKINAKFGFGADVGASFYSKDIAQMAVGVEGGIYFDAVVAGEINLDASAPSIKDVAHTDAAGKIEIGSYFEPNVNASINLGFKKFETKETLAENKKVFFTWGDPTMIIGIEPEKQNIVTSSTNFKLPTIYKKVKDISTGKTSKEEINPREYKVTDKEGKLISGQMNLDKNNQVMLVVEYYENNRTYKTQVFVTVKEAGYGNSSTGGGSGNKTNTQSDSGNKGTNKKRITVEEAQKLAAKIYGTEDKETGYPMGYSWEAMVKDKNGLEYYLFRIRWLVDNSHWSTLGGVAISVDGTKWKAVNIYDNYKDGDTMKNIGKEGSF